MNKEKKKVSDVKKTSDFQNLLSDICFDDSLADEVVQLLDDMPDSVKELKQCRNFSKLYVITLFQKYCDEDIAEFCLAIIGFMSGFDTDEGGNVAKPLGKREVEFWKVAHEYNSQLRKHHLTTEQSINTTLRKDYKEIIKKLEKEVLKQMDDNEEKLGLVDLVLERFESPKCYNSKTKTLILPRLRHISEYASSITVSKLYEQTGKRDSVAEAVSPKKSPDIPEVQPINGASKNNGNNSKESDNFSERGQKKYATLRILTGILICIICMLIICIIILFRSFSIDTFDDPYQKPTTETGKPKTQNNTGKKEQKSTQDNSLGEHKKNSTKVNYTFEFPLGIKFSGEVSVEKIEEPQE